VNDGGEGGIGIPSPCGDPAAVKQKKYPYDTLFEVMAGRAGFEYHPPVGTRQLLNKKSIHTILFLKLWRGGRDSNTIPLWGPGGC